jgi:hypothetical protein
MNGTHGRIDGQRARQPASTRGGAASRAHLPGGVELGDARVHGAVAIAQEAELGVALAHLRVELSQPERLVRLRVLLLEVVVDEHVHLAPHLVDREQLRRLLGALGRELPLELVRLDARVRDQLARLLRADLGAARALERRVVLLDAAVHRVLLARRLAHGRLLLELKPHPVGERAGGLVARELETLGEGRELALLAVRVCARALGGEGVLEPLLVELLAPLGLRGRKGGRRGRRRDGRRARLEGRGARARVRARALERSRGASRPRARPRPSRAPPAAPPVPGCPSPACPLPLG